MAPGDEERDRAREALETDAAELYEHAPCAYLSTLQDGTIIRANQTFLDWIGTARETIVGRVRFQSLLTIGARIYYETHYAPLLQMQGFVNEIALEVRRADSSVRPVVASARQIRDEHGAVTVNRVALFDSTDRRRYEHELLQARKRAEQSARELADADRRKNEFIAMLAHELRNPLAPIRSAVEILRRADRTGQSVSTTGPMLQRQVAHLARLVEDLLDVSRIGQDKLTVRRVPVDLASVVHHAVEASEPLLQAARLTFTARLCSDPIYVDADAVRLVQVFENILNNAAKFTPPDGVVMLIVEREGSDALIRVRDTGIGIDPSQLPQVFNLFMQANPSLERRGGLGIGLMLARSLIEQHGGRITVHSEGLGHGTEFVVRLPALSQPLESVSRTLAPAPETAAVPRRILVVDDNHDAANLMAMLLGLLGHDVRLAHDGIEAIDMADTFQPDMVLLDIGLPRLNGYDAARRIRARGGVQPLLVALTGWGQEEDRRKSSEAGFDVHLVKPVDHDVLIKLIADLPESSHS